MLHVYKYAIAHFSSMNGELTHLIVYNTNKYEASLVVLTASIKQEYIPVFRAKYPTYESLQEEYLPAVEEWLSVLPLD